MFEEKLIENYFDRLWPICRSITGNGLRESLKIIGELVPLKFTEVKTGTQVFDWVVPKEWNIDSAYIITSDGERICDFAENNLHVVNYSIPVELECSFEELEKHLHYIKEIPDAIPYITSYYKETWGFCISYNQFLTLNRQGRYKVVINSSLKEGALTYAEAVLKGSSEKEVLFSTYLCHPSMANNELSGPLVQAFLYKKIAALKNRKYTYRFLFAPETIGVISYLNSEGQHLMKNLAAGYVVTCCGDAGKLIYKKSKRGDSLADRVAEHVLIHCATPNEIIPFSVGGSDERQYCSPKFNLPVGSLTRSMYQRYKEYHTSLDNKSFISFSAMKQTIDVYFGFCQVLEAAKVLDNVNGFCEPQLGKRGLYPNSANPMIDRQELHDMLTIISYSDGATSLLEIANKRNVYLPHWDKIVGQLIEKRVLIDRS